MNGERHNLPAILLHWLQAGLILWLLWLGWTMVDLPKGNLRSGAYALHKSLGLLSLGVVLLRLFWRRHRPPPPPLQAGRRFDLARAVHRTLYGFLLLAPVAGYLATSFTPYPLRFFGLDLPKLGWPDETLNGVFKSFHWALVWGGAGLVGLHVLGALAHRGVLARMAPWPLSRN